MISVEQLSKQLEFTLKKTDFPTLGEKYEGKVRDNYTADDKRFIIVTDRLSAFDRVITTIPFKGQVLNQMARFWFENTADIIGNHVIEYPDPNVVLAKECRSLPVEMVVRGYLTGSSSTSAWTHYANGGREFCGNVLPEGMKKDQKFITPILTPSTKAEKGEHDESVSREVILNKGIISEEQFDFMAEKSMQLFAKGTEIAAKQGIILVDTKYEFGLNENDEIVLIDEIHTPDSSRFWYMSDYEERFQKGDEQKKIDKEYLRRWLLDQGFNADGEIPVIPDEVRIETARLYIQAFELITGQNFVAEVGDINERLTKNLSKYLTN